MTQSIPDGISFEELSQLQDSARHEADCHCEQCEGGPFDGKTAEQVCEIAGECLDRATEKCNDPMVHKVMALQIIENMIAWHTNVGVDQDNERSSVAWLRDAGKFQAIANILTQVTCGPNDFTCGD